jgi:hypothetical protein
MLNHKPLFQSFFGAGFECSYQRLSNGKRLDLLAATKHARFVTADYERILGHDIRYAREGVRWHLVESHPDRYDFASVLPMVRAARARGVQVIWDLCHFGWPDDIDIWRPEFARRFARYARAFAALLRNETDAQPFIVPINEMSLWAWAGGDMGKFAPSARGRSFELKAQFVRASIEAIEAFRSVIPATRIVSTEPVIHVTADPARPHDRRDAEGFRMAQYQAWDMLTGRMWPMLGGDDKYLDIVGINYYPWNQWVFHSRETIHRPSSLYRPFRDILAEVYARYRRTLFISETSAEDDERVPWLRYVSEEVRAAMQAGVPLEGLCIYPILDYPGWDDERLCCTGLWDYATPEGRRNLYQPLAEELQHQARLMDELQRRHTATPEPQGDSQPAYQQA